MKISKPFYLAMYHVTQGEYEKVMGVNPSAFCAKQMDAAAFQPPLPERVVNHQEKVAKEVAGEDTSRHPVETVSWSDAMKFCRKLSSMSAEQAARRVCRLPTEAEWEYACRAGTTTWWFSGDDEAALPEYAWTYGKAGGMTHPVGQKKPNGWGLHDMHGNVWQWCNDCFAADYYKHSPSCDPIGPSIGGVARVLRGGTWGYGPITSRSAFRNGRPKDGRNGFFGFRVACAVAATNRPLAGTDPPPSD